METKMEKPTCYGRCLKCSKVKKEKCDFLIDYIMPLYEKPQPSIIIYSGDLIER